jgi:anti-anti-sigma regulatory factor
MLKILRLHMANGTQALKLEGRVIGPWVDELQRSCEGALATGAGLALDLSDVSFIDRKGLALFRGLKDLRVVFLNCSLFVTEQLKAEVLLGRDRP